MVRSVLLALLLVALPAEAGDGWRRARVGRHPFSVEVPEATTTDHRTSDWLLGRAETDSLRAALGAGRLSASVTVAPETALRLAGAYLVYTTTRQTILDEAKGRMTGWTDVTRAGLSGKRLTYEATHAGQPCRGVMEVYTTGPYILTIDALVPPGTPPGMVDRFLASVALTPGT